MSKWFPVILFIVVALAVLVWGANRQAKLNARYFEYAVTNELRTLYDELTKPNTNQAALTPDAIVLALLNNQTRRHSSFLDGVSNPTNIYVEAEPTQVGGTNLICVVRTGERSLYGVDAKGACRRVSQGELQFWPHTPLSDNERLR